MNKHPIVRVRWRDPTGYEDWRYADDPTPVFTVHTLGYLLRNDDEQVVIAASVSDEQFGSSIAIPTSVVDEITVLIPEPR